MRSLKNSSSVAKARLKFVLLNDRANTESNNDMLGMLKQDMIDTLGKYVEVDESEVDININTKQNIDEGKTSYLTASFPIRQVKVLGRNKH